MKRNILIACAYLLGAIHCIDIDCDKSETVNEEHIHLCCKHPDGHNELIENCAKQTGFQLPGPKEQAMLDISSDKAIHSVCFAECIFRKLNFQHGDIVLDMTVVRKYFQTEFKSDAEYASEMINAFEHCHGARERRISKYMTERMQHECGTNSSVILSCVVREFFRNCPQDRWSKTDECQTALTFSKKCPDTLSTL